MLSTWLGLFAGLFVGCGCVVDMLWISVLCVVCWVWFTCCVGCDVLCDVAMMLSCCCHVFVML